MLHEYSTSGVFKAVLNAVEKIAKCVSDTKAPSEEAILLNESLGRIEILSFAAAMARSLEMSRNAAKANPEMPVDDAEVINTVLEMLHGQYEDYNADVDKDVAVALIDFYKANAGEGDAVMVNGKDLRKIDTRRFVDNMFKKSIFTSEEKLRSKPITDKLLKADPAVQLANGLVDKLVPLRGQIMEKPSGVEEGRAPVSRRQHDLPPYLRHGQEL